MIDLDKSSHVFRFSVINLFPVVLMIPQFAPSQMLKKKNYIKVLPILIQADQGSAKNTKINMTIDMTNSGDQAFCNYKTAQSGVLSVSRTRNFVQTDEAKFKV